MIGIRRDRRRTKGNSFCYKDRLCLLTIDNKLDIPKYIKNIYNLSVQSSRQLFILAICYKSIGDRVEGNRAMGSETQAEAVHNQVYLCQQ